MATDTKTNVVKVRPAATGQDNNSSKGKAVVSTTKKGSESSSKQSLDSRIKSVSTAIKSEVKSKSGTSTSKTTTVTGKKVVKEKKVYTLPGQKYDPPEEREPLRIFYESLSKQIPSSEMAEFWLMEHGMLSPERAKRAYEKKQRKQKQMRMGTPVKSPNPPNRAESSQRQKQAAKNGDIKAKKRISNDSDDDDFILSPKRRKG